MEEKWCVRSWRFSNLQHVGFNRSSSVFVDNDQDLYNNWNHN